MAASYPWPWIAASPIEDIPQMAIALRRNQWIVVDNEYLDVLYLVVYVA